MTGHLIALFYNKFSDTAVDSTVPDGPDGSFLSRREINSQLSQREINSQLRERSITSLLIIDGG